MHSSLVLTSICLIALAPLFMILSFRIIRYRRKKLISLGHKDDGELLKRVRAHANFVEYTPFFLILLAICEAQQVNSNLILILGSIFVLGRYFHAYGVSKNIFNFRVPGMVMTFLPLLAGTIGLLFKVLERAS